VVVIDPVPVMVAPNSSLDNPSSQSKIILPEPVWVPSTLYIFQLALLELFIFQVPSMGAYPK
jgi:hypothetical protein